jgi:uncharacterized repeat protein (TIGR04138 family)
MSSSSFFDVVQLIRKEDARYDPGAYAFMRKALDFTINRIREAEDIPEGRHITGEELCEGIRDFALEQYGPMTFTLFNEWGVRRTEDFGEIVFNLVEYGVFGKTEKDDRADFVGLYDFEETFAKPFRPKFTPCHHDRTSSNLFSR